MPATALQADGQQGEGGGGYAGGGRCAQLWISLPANCHRRHRRRRRRLSRKFRFCKMNKKEFLAAAK